MAVKVLEQVAGDFNPRSSLEPLLHHRLSHPNVVAMFDVCTQVSTWQVHAAALVSAVPLCLDGPAGVWGCDSATGTPQAVSAQTDIAYLSRCLCPYRIVLSPCTSSRLCMSLPCLAHAELCVCGVKIAPSHDGHNPSQAVQD